MWRFVCFYYGPFHVESCPALCSHVCAVLFSIVITSHGEDGDGLCASHAFLVYFACVNFCPFSLPLGARDCLRLVNVALPGLCY